MTDDAAKRSVLVTGGGGYIGTEVVRRLAARAEDGVRVVATDVRIPPAERKVRHAVYQRLDVRDAALGELLNRYGIDTVVHLAAVVTPGKKRNAEFERSVDVLGTENVARCAVEAGVEQLVVTSSGAAYGYHADTPVPVMEDAPLRANASFTYADNKRQVETLLAEYRESHPELKQLVFRPGVVLGERTSNQITDLFRKRVMLAVRGFSTPWTFVWDEDVAGAILHGVEERSTGIYNLVGDGAVPLEEVAKMVGIPLCPLPVWLLREGIRVLSWLGATQFGPEQVDFLRYRPVLSNERLKSAFGYVPRKTSRETLEYFLEHRQGAR